MIRTLLGKKIGMTQVFDSDGNLHPVTVIQLGPCVVLQVKKEDGPDRYNALQLGFADKREKNTTNPAMGHFRKVKSPPQRFIREVEWDGDDEIEPGQKLGAGLFKDLKYVDVIGTTKGRGFAGVVKRYRFAGGPATHGQSDRHRAPGSIGNSASPGRVWKGQKMPGQMGNVRRTIHGLKVIEVDEEKNLLLVKGGVPGPNGGYVMVRRGLRENILAHEAKKS